jgi:hypothetical protein
MITCAVFVLDATTLEVMSAKITEKMKSFQTLMNQRGTNFIYTCHYFICTEDKGENHAVRYPNKQDGGCSQKVGFSLFSLKFVMF